MREGEKRQRGTAAAVVLLLAQRGIPRVSIETVGRVLRAPPLQPVPKGAPHNMLDPYTLFFLRPHLLYPPCLLLSKIVATQIRGHKVWQALLPPPPPTTVLALEGVFIARGLRPFLPLSTINSIRLRPHTQQLIGALRTRRRRSTSR